MSAKQDIVDNLRFTADIFAEFGPEVVARQQFKYIKDLYTNQPEIFDAAFGTRIYETGEES
jgi:hypothetical protein